ncbi:MAG: hypothetical protein V3R88_03650 [Alphaproteobacteria bacterium]
MGAGQHWTTGYHRLTKILTRRSARGSRLTEEFVAALKRGVKAYETP